MEQFHINYLLQHTEQFLLVYNVPIKTIQNINIYMTRILRDYNNASSSVKLHLS